MVKSVDSNARFVGSSQHASQQGTNATQQGTLQYILTKGRHFILDQSPTTSSGPCIQMYSCHTAEAAAARIANQACHCGLQCCTRITTCSTASNIQKMPASLATSIDTHFNQVSPVKPPDVLRKFSKGPMADALTPPLGRTAPLDGTPGTASLPTLAGVSTSTSLACLFTADDACIPVLVRAAALASPAAATCTPFGCCKLG